MSPFIKEQLDQLLKLLTTNSAFGTHNTSVAQTGSNHSIQSCSLTSVPWIIDSGTLDHMTNFSIYFIDIHLVLVMTM